MARRFGSSRPQNTPIAGPELTLEDRDATTLPNVPQSSTTDESDVEFESTEEQRRYKARFWYRYHDTHQIKTPAQLTTVEINKIASCYQLDKWMSRPGFKQWFLNEQENTERLESLFTLALDEAEDIIRSRDPRALASKVQMIKLVAELASKFPKTSDDKFKDKMIDAMDKTQLKEFLKKRGFAIDNTSQIEEDAK